MEKVFKYTIFETKWGFFGLAGADNILYRSHLPVQFDEIVMQNLLRDLPAAHLDKNLFKGLQEQIIAYFDGNHVDFDEKIQIALLEFSFFACMVLNTLREVTFGQTISYGQLAANADKPGASRAIGAVMAKNPIPLIIPCHRVIKADGAIGGFSATGGTKTKEKLLLLEQAH